MRNLLLAFAIIILNSCSSSTNNSKEQLPISLDKFSDGIHHWNLFSQNFNYKRFSTDSIEAIGRNFVKYQNPDGGWPKNMDWLANINVDSLKHTLTEHALTSTFDNDNTHPQIEFLSKLYYNTGNDIFKESAKKGLEYIINTQRPSGGWRGWDVDAITFNDNVMTGIMHLLLDIKENKSQYQWISKSLKEKLIEAEEKALSTILKCQIVVNNKKKGWCQQHSHETFKPVKARTYELPSIASKETTAIIQLLMRVAKPNDSIYTSIKDAIQWLEESKLHNIRIKDIQVPKGTYKGVNLDIDRVVINDSTAPPIWARFYEIETNKPFMCTRAGKKVYSLAEVNPERRAGYGWYGYWPEELLSNEYPKWLAEFNKQ